MQYTAKEREYYNSYRQSVCERLSITEAQYNWFRRMGDKLHMLYERQCNGYTQKFFEEQDGKREEYWNKQINDKAIKLGLFVYYQSDPRGATIYLSETDNMTPSNYNNGVCVY